MKKLVLLLLLLVMSTNLQEASALETTEMNIDGVSIVFPGVDEFTTRTGKELDLINKVSFTGNEAEAPFILWSSDKGDPIIIYMTSDDSDIPASTRDIAQIKNMIIDKERISASIQTKRNKLIKNGADANSIIIDTQACNPATDRMFSILNYTSHRQISSDTVKDRTILNSLILVKGKIFSLTITSDTSNKAKVISLAEKLSHDFIDLNPNDKLKESIYIDKIKNSNDIDYTLSGSDNNDTIKYKIRYPDFLKLKQSDNKIGVMIRFSKKENENGILSGITITENEFELHPKDRNELTLLERSCLYADAINSINEKFFLQLGVGTVDRQRIEVCGFPAIKARVITATESSSLTFIDGNECYYIFIGNKVLEVKGSVYFGVNETDVDIALQNLGGIVDYIVTNLEIEKSM